MSRSMIAGAALAGALVRGAAHAHQRTSTSGRAGVDGQGDASDKLVTVDARGVGPLREDRAHALGRRTGRARDRSD